MTRSGVHMGRHDNQDYYKVAGKTIEGRDEIARSRAKLGTDRAALRRETPRKATARKGGDAVAPGPKTGLATVHPLHESPRRREKRRSNAKRAAERPPVSPAPPPAEPPRVERVRHLWERARATAAFAKELVLAPWTLLQLLREIRESRV